MRGGKPQLLVLLVLEKQNGVIRLFELKCLYMHILFFRHEQLTNLHRKEEKNIDEIN